MTPGSVEIFKILAEMGGTVLITVLLIWFAWKVIEKFGTQFIQTQQQIAEAMCQQAQCMSDVKDTVTEFVGRDNSEHREILLSMQVVGRELQTLTSEVRRQNESEG